MGLEEGELEAKLQEVLDAMDVALVNYAARQEASRRGATELLKGLLTPEMVKQTMAELRKTDVVERVRLFLFSYRNVIADKDFTTVLDKAVTAAFLMGQVVVFERLFLRVTERGGEGNGSTEVE